MKTERQRTGKKGEDEACLYLQNLGHTILARNWRRSRTELDIVSLNCEGIHFVEVKSRRAPLTADPEVNVTGAKIRNIVNAAGTFLRTESRGRWNCMEVFFDVVTVVFDGPDTIINYYPSAFRPMFF